MGLGLERGPIMRGDSQSGAIAIVEMGFEDLHAFARDCRATDTADQLLALAAEHDTGDHLYPPAL